MHDIEFQLQRLGLYPQSRQQHLLYNVRAYGAVGDGRARPLSGVYATLAQAQAVFPRATALTESLEWHAHQKAIDVAAAAGGGIVYTPRGRYKMSPCPDALKFPLKIDGTGFVVPPVTSSQVNWLGDGDMLSTCEWTADMGAVPNEKYAVMCGNQAGDPTNQQSDSRYDDSNAAQSSGWFKDLSIVGPALTLLPANTKGEIGCNMSGVCWASRRQLENFRVSWFYAGLDLVGDHTAFHHVFATNCYYGWYHNHRSPTLYGDLAVSGKCHIEACRFACVGFAYGGQMGNWHVSGRMFLGQSPFAFFKEATPSSPAPAYTAVSTFMAGIQFDSLMVEAIGNALIWDDNIRVSGATNSSTLDRCLFRAMSFATFSDTNKLAAYDRCQINVCNINGCEFNFTNTIYADGCTRPVIDVAGTLYGESLLSGDIEASIASAAAAGQPLLEAADTSAKRMAVNHTHGDGSVGCYRGHFQAVYSGTDVTAGQALTKMFYGVRPALDSHVSPFAGLARSSSTGGCCVVAEEGDDVPYTGTGTNSWQTAKKLSSVAGSLTDASSMADGRVVGYSGAPTRLNMMKGYR